ncbi:MAG TPA: aminotransferase class V-fold PLP-dependent enzyme [Dermatophilaceae bacterium]|jgi:selenocysteine lyase/cysteine desulfurase|nr:aminotransferase class V-fold PLP-dependent enzyme [Dermatophilaceae bacterium]HMT89189.1 aminotransferase class V-fold PLP-dependent enzyme [Dermatophilaceae bacterium]
MTATLEAPAALCAGVPATATDGLQVPVADGWIDYANFDHAASTPALRSVASAVERVVAGYGSVHRGNGHPSRVTSQWYDQAREEVGRFVGARATDHVVFTRNTTDSWTLLAHALPADTTVVAFASEHHSTLLPWGAHRTVTLGVPATVADGIRALDRALGEVTSRHSLVVVAGASNVTGDVWPIADIVAVAHRHGARVALDAAQLAPHRRIDLAGWDVDYVALSGHKIYAPYGTGVLAGRGDWLDTAAPYLPGGGATVSVTESEVVWALGPARHEGGTPNVVGAVALAAACAALAEHRADIALYEHALGARLRRGLAAIPGVRLHTLFGSGADQVAVVAFTVDGLEAGLVSTALSVEYGIGVRDGRFCAHRLVDHLLGGDSGVAAGSGGSHGADTLHRSGMPSARLREVAAVRASLGLATRPHHVERLITAVTELAASGPALSYVPSEAGWETPSVAAATTSSSRLW